MASELAAAALFLGAVALVYILAALSLLEWVFERRGLKAPPGRRRLLARRLVLALAFLGLLCFAYGYFIEPYWLEVTRVTIAAPQLAGAARPVRIVHISDVHSDPAPRLEERLPGAIAGLAPDLIVFTGDSFNSPDGVPVFRRLMTRLAEVAPTYAVKGNWDVGSWPRHDPLRGTGVRELDGEGVKVEAAGAALWLCGAPAGDARSIARALDGAPADLFTVFLNHHSDEVYEAARRGIDLYCAGHTHGGQVALPFYGALVTLSKFGKRFEAGLYRVDRTWLYVTRGIGMEGGSAPRVRFCARPEVTLIEVRPER
jgi:predicted MPP superfamily phosphohydrolase